ncbi:MAG: cobalamin-dependent protein [Firmicutes bacterium]|nr:cobalamin-dependent protein [Bacillota bacterium]
MFDYELITKQQEELSKKILAGMYPNSKFSSEERELKALKDVKWMLMFIIEALKVNNKRIVINIIIWLKRLMKSLDIGEEHIDLLFLVTKQVLDEEFHNHEVNSFLDSINKNDFVVLNQSTNLKFCEEKEAYLNALLESNRNGAQKVINDMLSNNVSIEDIYQYVFTEAMRNVGELWHDGKISVGVEHYCTAVTQYMMSSMYDKIFSSERKDKKLMACAVGSELHEMGIRMVTDIFELNGWDTYYLGANLPIPEIIGFAKKHNPDIIALSITMPYHLGLLKETIDKIKSDSDLKEIKIIVGGLPFIDNDELSRSLGADGYASNASEGLSVANELLL